MELESVEKGLKNIYFNLGHTNADKASAVAKGSFAALAIYAAGRLIPMPTTISLLTLIGVGIPLGIAAADAPSINPHTSREDNSKPLIDQQFRFQGKTPLRAWLTGVTLGSIVLLTDSFIRTYNVSWRSTKMNTLSMIPAHWGLSGLFIRAGANHRMQPDTAK